MPDLSLSFVNPRLFDDVSFHPCVRFRRWESERVLSFVPPDGNFRLMSYHIGAQNMVSIPIYIRHHISFKEVGAGKIEIQIGPKQTMGKLVMCLAFILCFRVYFRCIWVHKHTYSVFCVHFYSSV
jgi:AP-3 complex subunit mu